MIYDNTMEMLAATKTRKLLGLPVYPPSGIEGKHRSILFRRWRLSQATLKGFRSSVESRYKAIHKRGLTVDHIVPLSGVDNAGNHIVCGLNVPWNLRGESLKDNRRKANLFVDSPDAIGIILTNRANKAL